MHLPLIRAELEAFPRDVVVVQGGQGVWDRTSSDTRDWEVVSGADLLAAEVAFELGMTVEEHPAAWIREDGSFDRLAGFRRNSKMLASGVDFVLAFWDGRSTGTYDTLVKARARGIPEKVIKI